MLRDVRHHRLLRRPMVTAFAIATVVVGGWSSFATAQTSDGLSAAVALEQALTQVIEQSESSVVAVARIRTAPGELMIEGGGLLQRDGFAPGGRPRDLLPNQFATGVIVSPEQGEDRWILTAYHAVRGGPVYGQTGSGDGSRLEIRLPSRHVLSATLWAADPRSDLAVLKLDYKDSGLRPNDLRPMPWATSAAVRKGQLVIVLGNPYWIARDGSPSAGWGMVSNIARRPASLVSELGSPQSLNALGGLIHLDYRLPIGTSGAPVMNLKGELVGLASSLAAIEGYERSGGFATPIDPSTRWIVETLLSGYEVEYGFLGINPGRVPRLNASDGSRRSMQASAAIAEKVHPGSPADAAGVRPQDVILAVNGEPTYSDLDLMRQVTLHPPGTTIRMTISRPRTADELTLNVKLGKWPVSDAEGVIATQRKHPLWRGLAVDYSTARLKFLTQDLQIMSAVLVTDVQPNTPAQAALLEPGVFITHVNRQLVRTPAEFAEAVRAAKGPVTLSLHAPDGTPKQVVVAE
ncbi:MAG: trypsin-like peptidase domain-containing protein [Planctomycetaceae bacterium]|nr:trypsin-like peptidase domain-containing protein [Planctomycetaceae bacterium]